MTQGEGRIALTPPGSPNDTPVDKSNDSLVTSL